MRWSRRVSAVMRGKVLPHWWTLASVVIYRTMLSYLTGQCESINGLFLWYKYGLWSVKDNCLINMLTRFLCRMNWYRCYTMMPIDLFTFNVYLLYQGGLVETCDQRIIPMLSFSWFHASLRETIIDKLQRCQSAVTDRLSNHVVGMSQGELRDNLVRSTEKQNKCIQIVHLSGLVQLVSYGREKLSSLYAQFEYKWAMFQWGDNLVNCTRGHFVVFPNHNVTWNQSACSVTFSMEHTMDHLRYKLAA